MLSLPIIEPGFRTALQPIWQYSPRNAPNLSIFVYILVYPTRTTTGDESSLRLEVMAPAAMWAPLATTESPT